MKVTAHLNMVLLLSSQMKCNLPVFLPMVQLLTLMECMSYNLFEFCTFLLSTKFYVASKLQDIGTL